MYAGFCGRHPLNVMSSYAPLTEPFLTAFLSPIIDAVLTEHHIVYKIKTKAKRNKNENKEDYTYV